MQGQARKPRMLVVDDEARNRKLIEGFLEAEGYELTSVASGPEALECMEPDPPDVVLLDVMMPGMTGYDVCRKIKQHPRWRLSQVMLVTALDGTTKKVEGLDVGADDYVAKPVRREEFLAKVRALVRARRLLVELETTSAELAERNRELELKKALAQNLVHDMKSPLQGVLGNLELMVRLGTLGPREIERVNRSQHSAQRLLLMIMNLLDIEALDAGELVLKKQACDVRDILRAAREEAEPSAAVSDVTIELYEAAPCWIWADRPLIRRVFDNLIANAILHTASGTTIDIGIVPRPEGIELAITDSGSGIPEEMRERIFEKYAQVDGAKVSGATNRGLGLTFCRMAVEAHGGTIWVENVSGRGARFRMILPEATAAQRSSAQSGIPTGSGGFDSEPELDPAG